MNPAADITRKAQSNLAFALRVVPAEHRPDLFVFYAFCRLVDDIADDRKISPEEKSTRLAHWSALLRGETPPREKIETAVLEMQKRRKIPPRFLEAIIAGCRSDIHPRAFQTWAELDNYIWHVAGAVGLVSVRLFGCTEPACDDYAVKLGHALQLTNILRDIREDDQNDQRFYLPAEILANHGISAAEIISGHGANYLSLMQDFADRAEHCFAAAEAALPSSEKHRLLPARIMADVYRTLLRRMRNDQFRFAKRYRLSKPELFLILARRFLAHRLRIE